MTDKYILNPDHSVRAIDDLEEWGAWFENVSNNRVVAKTLIGSVADKVRARMGGEGIEVSTVFLGLDSRFGGGPPLLFETLVFGGPLDQETTRYSTWAEAEAGHAEMVRRCEEATSASAEE